jgi:hypothetical protein
MKIASLASGLVVFLLLSIGSASAQRPAGDAKKATVMAPQTVPVGKTYVQVDDKGKEIKRFKSGEKTTFAVADCVMVNCPRSFDRDVVCWKCVERLKTK